MEKINRWIKHNLLFFISLVVLFLSVVFSVVIFQLFRLQSQTESTHVGHIYLGANEAAYESVLNDEINTFLSNAEYTIVYQEHELEVDLSLFDFDEDETVNQIRHDQNNVAYFTFLSGSASQLVSDLSDTFGSHMIQHIDVPELIDGIQTRLGTLDYFYQLNLEDYLLNASSNVVLQSKTLTVDDSTIVNELSEINEILVDGHTTFSLLTYLEDQELSNATLSFIASAMFNLSLESHFTNVIAHRFNTLPNWADIYTNVQVLSQNEYDYSFYNPFYESYTFEFVIENANTVTVSLIGSPYSNTYTFIEDVQTINYPTIVVDDPTIVDPPYIIEDNSEQTIYERTLQTGMNGSLTSFIIQITLPNGSIEEIVVDKFRDEAVPEIIGRNIVEKDGE